MGCSLNTWCPQMETSCNAWCASSSSTRTQCRATWKTSTVGHLLLDVRFAQRFAKINPAWRNTWGPAITFTNLPFESILCFGNKCLQILTVLWWSKPLLSLPSSSILSNYLLKYFILEANKTQCSVCLKFIHRNTISRHMKNLHGDSPRVQCQHCEKICKNLTSYKDHLRRDHSIYQSNWWQLKKTAIKTPEKGPQHLPVRLNLK